MSERRLTVTEAARGFADLINRVFYRRESALLLKNGTPVARVVPVDAAPPTPHPASRIAELWRGISHLSPEDADAFAADVERARAALPPPRTSWA